MNGFGNGSVDLLLPLPQLVTVRQQIDNAFPPRTQLHSSNRLMAKVFLYSRSGGSTPVLCWGMLGGLQCFVRLPDEASWLAVQLCQHAVPAPACVGIS